MLLALGLLVLVGLWWLGRSGGTLPRFAGLAPRTLAGYALLALAALLGVRGSLLAATLLAGGGLWLLSGSGGLGRALGRLAGRAKASARGPTHESVPGRRVRTATAEFDLDPDGRPRDGLILAGPLSGRRLSEAGPADLLALRSACEAADPDGARGLEAYLDRRLPGWRVHAQADAHARPGRPLQPGTMTEEEAHQILGLERGASLEQVRAAHRALMKRLHPDRLDPGPGDTSALAARVNAARDRLLNRHR